MYWSQTCNMFWRYQTSKQFNHLSNETYFIFLLCNLVERHVILFSLILTLFIQFKRLLGPMFHCLMTLPASVPIGLAGEWFILKGHSLGSLGSDVITANWSCFMSVHLFNFKVMGRSVRSFSCLLTLPVSSFHNCRAKIVKIDFPSHCQHLYCKASCSISVFDFFWYCYCKCVCSPH